MRPPVAILCGGRGTRLQEHTRSIPKPLVEIGGRPIVWHVINIYLAQGFTRFLLLTGYKAEMIEQFARDTEWPDGASVQCVDTGLDTPTGGRIRKAAETIGNQRFCATYADGVADVDLAELLSEHERHGSVATLTAVKPELQFGVAQLSESGIVEGFIEKPRSEHWVNGGFFCFEPGVYDVLEETSILEREPFETLARSEQLRAYKHYGFWECMDTYKDAILLNDLWASGRAPWRVWA
jgi:glucose-1-phosphate cytidylyltransferase